MIQKKRMQQGDMSGFTLVEVIVVLIVIAVLGSIALPGYMKWMPNIRLKSTARDLYGNMQKMRMVAVKDNRTTAIIFDPANNRYTLCENWDGPTSSCVGGTEIVDFNDLKSEVGYGHGNANLQVTGAALPLAPDDDVSYTPPDNVVSFDPRGLADAGYVYLDHQEHTTTFAVGSLLSGAVRLLRWDGSKWE